MDEREVTCAGCGGDGCVACDERGFYCAEFEPITLADLEEMSLSIIQKDKR